MERALGVGLRQNRFDRTKVVRDLWFIAFVFFNIKTAEE